MKVRMLTLSAGPFGVRHPGQEIDVPEAEAKALLDGGFAELVEAAKPDPVKPAKPKGK